MSVLGDIGQKISAAIKDMSSLEVKTYIGEMTTKVNGQATDIADLLSKSKTTGKLHLVRYTKSELDGDVVNIIHVGTEGVPAVPSYVAEAHDASVKAAQDLRKGIVQLVTGAGGKD